MQYHFRILKNKNIIALSGVVDEKIMKKTSLIPKTNIYISHGTNDNLINYETSKESLNFYIENDIKFKFESYDQGHGINQQNLEAMIKWLIKITKFQTLIHHTQEILTLAATFQYHDEIPFVGLCALNMFFLA